MLLIIAFSQENLIFFFFYPLLWWCTGADVIAVWIPLWGVAADRNPFHGRKHQQQQQYPSASHRIPIPLRPHPTPSMSNVYVCCVLRCPRRGVSIRSFLLVNLACEARSLPLSGYSHAFACVAMCSVRRQWNEYVPQHRDVAHRATANWDDLDLWQLWKARYQNEREFLSFGVICHRVVLV